MIFKKAISTFMTIVIVMGLITIPIHAQAEDTMTISNMQVQDMKNPIGIDTLKPVLSYQLDSNATAKAQSAYRIIVASTSDKLNNTVGDLWDSGKVMQSKTFAIVYDGMALASRQRAYWKVMAWDENDKPTVWSDTSYWEAGLLNEADWQASWIGRGMFPSLTPGGSDIKNIFTSAVDTQYIKINVTESGPAASNETTKKYLQIMEVEAYSKGKKVSISAITSTDPAINTTWAINNMIDGDKTTGYSSTISTNPKNITITIDLGVVKNIDELRLWSRTDIASVETLTIGNYTLKVCSNYAKTYTLTESNDGQTYKTISKTLENATPVVPTSRVVSTSSSPMFAKEFETVGGKTVSQARLYSTGLGVYEAYINGDKVKIGGRNGTETFFGPGETDYRKTVLYETFDVTNMLADGGNAVGLILGEGISSKIRNAVTARYQKINFNTDTDFYYPPMGFAQLEISYTDGTVQTIATDDTWYYNVGATIFNSWYGGEEYDATQEIAGWCNYGTDRSKWGNVELVRSPGQTVNGTFIKAKTKGKEYPPITVQENGILTPTISTLTTSSYIVDMTRNGAGFPEINLNNTTPAMKGIKIRMVPSEKKSITNNVVTGVNQASSTENKGPLYDTYTIKGTGVESWHPQFIYHGYRYLLVDVIYPAGYSGQILTLNADNFRGYLLRTSNEKTGSFNSSSEDLNWLDTIISRSIESNMYSSFTDCPQIEKLGWLEQSNLMFYSMSQTYDISAWMRKIVQDVKDSQFASGCVPAVAPAFRSFLGYLSEDVNWNGVCAFIPWNAYEVYGDTSMMQLSYDTMTAYTDYLAAKAASGVGTNRTNSKQAGDTLFIPKSNQSEYLIWFAEMGDWGAPIKRTPVELVNSCAFYNVADIVSKTAEILGKTDDVLKYRTLANNIKREVNFYYYDNVTGVYGSGSQGSYACPLYAGLVENENIAKTVTNLAEAVTANAGHLSTGEVALKQMITALAKYGRSDMVYKMIMNPTSPSYIIFKAMGVTTLPEYWDNSRSENHAMMGSVKEWFSRYVAGINNESPGYERITIRPYIPQGVGSAEATVVTPYGKVNSKWKYNAEKDSITMNVTIPVGSVADIYVPAFGRETISLNLNGKSVSATRDTSPYFQDYFVIPNVGSGEYTIDCNTGVGVKDIILTGTTLSYTVENNTGNDTADIYTGVYDGNMKLVYSFKNEKNISFTINTSAKYTLFVSAMEKDTMTPITPTAQFSLN